MKSVCAMGSTSGNVLHLLPVAQRHNLVTMNNELTFKCTCGRTVTKTPAHLADTFCSASCARSFMKGFPLRDKILARRLAGIRPSKSFLLHSPGHKINIDWVTIGATETGKMESGQAYGIFVERNQTGEERYVISNM